MLESTLTLTLSLHRERGILLFTVRAYLDSWFFRVVIGMR
jgi:hypothetical protein